MARFLFSLEGQVEGIRLVNPFDAEFVFHGSGTVKYTEVTIPAPNDVFQYPNTFNVNAWVTKFKPCKSNEFSILIDIFGAETEPRVANGLRMDYPGEIGRASCLESVYI